jgi:uncharacterized protein YdhG (YjbR/CyaY superfamily)
MKTRARRMAHPAKDINAYLREVPPAPRAALRELRRTIRSAAPKAEEGISYGIPVFKYHGPLVFFAAFKDHCSLFAVGKSILKTFDSQLKPFRSSGTTIHFSPDKPLPKALVRKIVKARIAENEMRAMSKLK